MIFDLLNKTVLMLSSFYQLGYRPKKIKLFQIIGMFFIIIKGVITSVTLKMQQ